MIKNEADIIRLIKQDSWMVRVLHAAQKLDLPDWWISAGFVRSKIWDVQHGYQTRTPLPDIDVIYFDEGCTAEAKEKEYEAYLRNFFPNTPWSVKNQARMHLLNGFPPYKSSQDGIAKFPETATALGVKLDSTGNILLTAPHGAEDAINMILKPSPFFEKDPQRLIIFEQRVAKKNWRKIWPEVKMLRLQKEDDLMIDFFRYNWQVRDEWFEWCQQLTLEQLTAQRTGGQGSILFTLFHIIDVEYSWIRAVKGMEDIRVDYAEYDTVEKLKTLSDRWRGEIEDFLTSYNDFSSKEEIYAPWLKMKFPAGEVFRHIISHEIHHTGQLSVWSRELNLKPVSANFIGRSF